VQTDLPGPSGEESSTAFSAEPRFGDDAALVTRIIEAYRCAATAFAGHGDSMWASISARSAALHAMLLNGPVGDVTAQLRYPASHDLLSGFDEAARSIYSAHKAGDRGSREAWGAGVHKRLIRLAEAVGAIPLRLQSAGRPDDRDLTVEGLLAKLDVTLGFKIDFPNPYPDEFGLKSSRGLFNHRALFAIYQAWRLFAWAGGNGRARILEIGAGSGRTAYYARKLGLHDYTIIDLPLSNVAQANFLGRVLDPSALVLTNENYDATRNDKIRIFGPAWFDALTEHFDVALNADSITEMDRRRAVTYFEKLASHAAIFVSINHEANPFSAAELPSFAGIGCRPTRYPYWLDESYVEETFLFRGAAPLEVAIEPEIKRLGGIILDLRRQAADANSLRATARRLLALAARRLFGE
jgi:SAM-dependent methyltransferase